MTLTLAAILVLGAQTSKVDLVVALRKNVLHDGDHYGNLVTCMRIKGLVPPSTEGQ